jgi:hypothetical protein
MLYWEAQRRLNEVRVFRDLVREYFSHTTWDNMGRRRPMRDLSELRTRINARIPSTVINCYKVGQSVSVVYKHPMYGIDGHVNVIENLFSLDSKRIPLATAFDYLDRTIGIYDKEIASLRKRQWNPFFWIRLGFLWLIGAPFRLLGAAGFNAVAVEQSFAGKLAKALWGLVIGLVTIVSGLLTILASLGFHTGWKDILPWLHRH